MPALRAPSPSPQAFWGLKEVAELSIPSLSAQLRASPFLG